jgi:septum formation protein
MIILASRSPRRAAILHQIGIPFSVHPVSVDESIHGDETACTYVTRLAHEKAFAVVDPAVPVLAADTAVVLDRKILGKPTGKEEGIAMLLALSGREHEVVTGVTVRMGTSEATRVASAKVKFREVSRAEAAAYWCTAEPVDKAGGYGIQGIGGIFVRRVSGSYGAIVGLPLEETHELLRLFGVDTWKFRGR